jgi:hypothetical protein
MEVKTISPEEADYIALLESEGDVGGLLSEICNESFFVRKAALDAITRLDDKQT